MTREERRQMIVKLLNEVLVDPSPIQRVRLSIDLAEKVGSVIALGVGLEQLIAKLEQEFKIILENKTTPSSDPELEKTLQYSDKICKQAIITLREFVKFRPIILDALRKEGIDHLD